MAPAGRSKSTRLLIAVLVAVLVVGLVTTVPSWWRRRAGLVDVQPQMLVVRAAAKGEFPLGSGMAVSLFDDGLRVLHEGDVVFASVPAGSVLSAGWGHLRPDGSRGHEELTSTLDNLEVSAASPLPSGVRYSGRLFSEHRSTPVSLTVTEPLPGRVDLAIAVPGARLVVLHTAREHLTLGLRPRLPERNLRDAVWWVGDAPPRSRTGSAYSTIRGVTVGVLAPRPTALDVRHDGRTDIHVWAPSLTLTLTVT